MTENAAAYGERWAPEYDELHRHLVVPEAQLDVLERLAAGDRVLELGIGTGRIALPLAARGVAIEGLDASSAMVAQLRAKPGGERVPVHVGDMAEIPLDGPYALVFVVFNTIFCLADQDSQVECFRNAARVLARGGAFLVEAFEPDLSGVERSQRMTALSVESDEVHLDVSRVDTAAQVITSNHVSIGPGGTTMRPIRLRYAWPSELDLMARLAGLTLESRYADWEASPFDASSERHVSVYRSRGDANVQSRVRPPSTARVWPVT